MAPNIIFVGYDAVVLARQRQTDASRVAHANSSSVKNAVQANATLLGDPAAAAMSMAMQARKSAASQASRRRKL